MNTISHQTQEKQQRLVFVVFMITIVILVGGLKNQEAKAIGNVFCVQVNCNGAGYENAASACVAAGYGCVTAVTAASVGGYVACSSLTGPVATLVCQGIAEIGVAVANEGCLEISRRCVNNLNNGFFRCATYCLTLTGRGVF